MAQSNIITRERATFIGKETTFGTTPAGWTLVGGAVILASTLWLARQESR